MSISPSHYPKNHSLTVLDDESHEIQRIPAKGDFLAVRNRLNLIKSNRTALAAEEREILKEFKSKGGSKRVMRTIRMLESMHDADERSAFIAELEAYATFLNY